MTETEAKAKAWDLLYDTIGVRVDHFYRTGNGTAMMDEKLRRVEMNEMLKAIQQNNSHTDSLDND